MTITEMAQQAHETAVEKGFWAKHNSAGVVKTEPEVSLSKLALIHAEVSEAVEYVRNPKFVSYVDNKKVEGELSRPGAIIPCESFRTLEDWEPFSEELADILIRVGDLAAAMNLTLEQAVVDKLAKNKTRPYLHGKLA